MECPYCNYGAHRMKLHKHLLDTHGEKVSPDGRNYVFSCPECGNETTVEPGTGEEPQDVLEKFNKEIRMMAFDRLLDHLEKEHGY